MIRNLALLLALSHPSHYDHDVTPWGGKNVRVWNQAGIGMQTTWWPERGVLIVTLGVKGKWMWAFRCW
jgi:hypothetical protein